MAIIDGSVVATVIVVLVALVLTVVLAVVDGKELEDFIQIVKSSICFFAAAYLIILPVPSPIK